MTSTKSTFFVPIINDNPEGWGPVGIPEDFENIPYAPFAKSDKLGKASDWSAQSNYQNRQFQSSRFQGQTVNSAFTYHHNEDEDSFQVVDNKPAYKPKSHLRKNFNQNKQNRNQPNQQNRNQTNQQNPAAARQGQTAKNKQNQKNKWQRNNQWTGGRGYDSMRIKREASVEVRPEWKVRQEIELSGLSKLSIDEVPTPEDLVSCGSLEYYDKTYDRITVANPKLLERIERTFFKVTTTDDSVIRSMSMKNEANVFGIDSIISLLMACPRSVYSWDVVVQRVGSKLFFDKRENSQFDFLTVNETASEPPIDEKESSINSPGALAHEATLINQVFSQQVLLRDSRRFKFPEANPFLQTEGEDVASVAYKYRRWRLSDDISVIIRCEIDGVLEGNQDLFLTIKTLNEFDPKGSGVDWRQKLDAQRGAVIATELKNNSNKIAKWVAQALLAGTDQLKLGFVSRSSPKDSHTHVILGSSTYQPVEFVSQINLNVKNMWAILKYFIDLCLKLPEGKYILLKDPNLPIVRLYDVPENTFETEEEKKAAESAKSA